MLIVLLLNSIARLVCDIGIKHIQAGEIVLSDGVCKRRLVSMRLKRGRLAQLPLELHRMFYNKMHSGIRCKNVRTLERKGRAHWFYRELDSHELKLEYMYLKVISHDQLLAKVA